jgi:ATP-dependent DNA helicase DinG
MAEESMSLFALKSFWEGFDAAGDTLRCVVIPKLPFASPRDPLVLERDVREQRAWWRYSLPEAVLSVKQAAGRLIRTNTDSGILVLADVRVSTKRYGQTFLNALPTSNATKLERASIGRYITLWRAGHER